MVCIFAYVLWCVEQNSLCHTQKRFIQWSTLCGCSTSSVPCFSIVFSASACHVPHYSTTSYSELTERYFFNQELARCEVFDGCPEEGANNFDTLADCHDTCGCNGISSV